MSHEYNITIHKSNIRLRMKHKQKLKHHDVSYRIDTIIYGLGIKDNRIHFK